VPESTTIIECPRDAWQGLPHMIPAETKAGYLRALIDAGFNHIDAVSFVSPTAVPQMADSERVLELLNPPANIKIIGIVVNEKGATRAVATGRVTTLGFPYSISPEFLRRNQNQTQQESLATLRAIASLAQSSALGVVAYISMAFGNPYNDPWTIESLIAACKSLVDHGITQISLADTVGRATADQISAVLAAVLPAMYSVEIGVHLHATRTNAPALIRAAYNAGCRRFDSAIGGLGGCPFAQDELVGNIPTEALTQTLADCGAVLPALEPLDQIILNSQRIAAGASAQPSGAT
jgi:hydroxymethylglutaryl-CoA lyase